MIQIFRSINIYNDPLHSLLPPYKPQSPFTLRNTDLTTPKFKIPRVNKNLYGMKCFDYLASNMWNSIPEELKLCKNLNDFRTRAKI